MPPLLKLPPWIECTELVADSGVYTPNDGPKSGCCWGGGAVCWGVIPVAVAVGSDTCCCCGGYCWVCWGCMPPVFSKGALGMTSSVGFITSVTASV